MKKFVTIKYFTDLQDNGHAYHEGDIFPREGLEVSDERIEELSTDANRRNEPLIKAVEDIPENTSPLTEEVPPDVETGESPVEEPKAKRKPRKSHARTDS